MEEVRIIISGIEHKLVEYNGIKPRCRKGNEPCKTCSLSNICVYPDTETYPLCSIFGGGTNSQFVRV